VVGAAIDTDIPELNLRQIRYFSRKLEKNTPSSTAPPQTLLDYLGVDWPCPLQKESETRSSVAFWRSFRAAYGSEGRELVHVSFREYPFGQNEHQHRTALFVLGRCARPRQTMNSDFIAISLAIS
jgi:hypothetical protein